MSSTGWKTFLFGLVVAIIGFLETFDFTTIFDGESGGVVTAIIGVVIIALRAVTKTPIFKKEE